MNTRKPAAPVELTRHIPVYLTVATGIAVVDAGALTLLAANADKWQYPMLGFVAMALLSIAAVALPVAWLTKPSSEAFAVREGRSTLWHEYVYVNTQTGKVMTTPYELEGQAIDDLVTWRYIGSSVVMAFGLLTVLGVVASVICLGYLNNPI